MLNVKTSYEIWSKTEDEPLVDNLSFDDAAEQIAVYMDFYGADVIFMCARDVRTGMVCNKSKVMEFKKEWINYFDELQQMGNLEFS